MGQASDGILIEAQKLTRIYSVGSAGVVGIQDIDLAIPRGELVVVKGESLHLEKMDFSLQILDHWKSPHTGAVYPSRWGIQVYPVDLDLSISSNLEDQELVTGKTTPITYWEGSVSVSGKARGHDIDGVGYVEMTGYARPFGLLK